jgi:uncharacterized repeat protein (TIGR01451 family)
VVLHGLPANTETEIAFEVLVLAAAAGDIVKNAAVMYRPDANNNPEENPLRTPETETPIGIPPTYHLDFTKSADVPNNSQVAVGQVVTYTIAVINNGEAVSGGVTIQDTVPAGMTLVPDSLVTYVDGVADSSIAPTIVGGTLTWYIPSIAVGTMVEVSFQATVDPLEDGVYEKVLSNTAVVNETDTNTVDLVAMPDEPTDEPSDDPTDEPTDEPSDEPTDEPPDEPSDEPSDEPTDEPSDNPSDEPTQTPSTPPVPEAPGQPPSATYPGTEIPAPIAPQIPWNPWTSGREPGVYTYVTYDQAPEFVPIAPTPVAHVHYAYMIGFAEDGTIRPHANITRAEVATIFFRLITDEHRANIWSQQNSFADVHINNWYNNPVSTMENGGLFEGIYFGENFNPNQPATRAELAVMIVNYLGLGHYRVTGGSAFVDIDGHWASDAINVANMMGWVTGFNGGTFKPDQPITRAEVAALVNRALGRLPETVDDLLPGMLTWPDNMDPHAWYYLYIQEATNSTYHERKADGIHIRWTSLIDPRDWRRLERPDSNPWDILW